MEDSPMDLRTCDENDFGRPVDWRIQKAKQLAEIAGLRPEQVIDLTLRVAVGYLLAEKGPQRKAASAETEVLDQAFRVYREDGPLRWELEARVLAGQSDDEIGSHFDLHPHVIACYEGLFYDVRSRLGPTMICLRHYIIGPGYGVPLQKEQVRELSAHEALRGGLAALDDVVKEFHRARRSRGPATLSVYFRRGVPLDLQATVASYLMPPEAYDWSVDFHRRLLWAETKDQEQAEKIVLGVYRSKVRLARKVLAGKPIPPRY